MDRPSFKVIIGRRVNQSSVGKCSIGSSRLWWIGRCGEMCFGLLGATVNVSDLRCMYQSFLLPVPLDYM